MEVSLHVTILFLLAQTTSAASVSWYEDPKVLVPAIVALLTATVSATIAIIIHRRTLQKRKILCVQEKPTLLVPMKEPVHSIVKMYHGQEPIAKAYLFQLEVSNIGNHAITKLPIHAEFDLGSRVVQTIIDPTPKNGFSPVSCSQHFNDKWTATIDLLNPKDKVRFSILSLDNQTDMMKVSSHHENVVAKIESPESLAKRGRIYSLGMTAFSAMMLTLLVWSIGELIGSNRSANKRVAELEKAVEELSVTNRNLGRVKDNYFDGMMTCQNKLQQRESELNDLRSKLGAATQPSSVERELNRTRN